MPASLNIIFSTPLGLCYSKLFELIKSYECETGDAQGHADDGNATQP